MNIKYIVGFIFIGYIGWGQTSKIHENPNLNYNKATDLSNQELFMPSADAFDKSAYKNKNFLLKQRDLFRGISAKIKAGEADANYQMSNFIQLYPTSPLTGNAALEIANFYFQKGDYNKVLQWYSYVDDYQVDFTHKDQYNFQKGYALFLNKKYNEAQKYLSQVKYNDTYANQARYYLGFIAYENENFSTAKDLFSKIEKENPLSANLSYYNAYMSFKEGDFEQAIKQGLEQLKKNLSANEKSELHKIVGESYFNLKDYKNAITHLQQYKGKKGRLSNTDYYYIGYSFYSEKDFEQAINYFNKIIGAHNNVAQNAYYHLGECYLQMNQKQEALNAFRNASQMDFNSQIKQNSALNYAKLSYEIGNSFESVPSVLKNYIDTYQQEKEIIQDLLLNAYISSKNYESAMSLLEKNKDVKSKKIYQQVAFLYGLTQYNDKKYNQAIELFKKAQNPIYTHTATRSLFWLGESYYQIRNTEQSIKTLHSFIHNSLSKKQPEFEKAFYTLGYLYFRDKDFKNAIVYLQQFVSVSKDTEKKSDAFMRIADSYFAMSDYTQAIQAYQNSINLQTSRADYAYFQTAIAYGLNHNNAQKIKFLEDFIRIFNSSTLRVSALYELARTQSIEGNNEKAIDIYKQIQKQYPMSAFVGKAMLHEGLIYYNQEKNKQALDLLKSVAEKFPNTTEATQAVSTVKLIYIDLGEIDTYAHWVKQLSFVSVSDQELENASFEAAEKQYTLENTENAIKGFENYLKKFPEGIHATESQFYLAQLYEKEENWAKAIPLFEKVSLSNNDFSEIALAKICQFQIDQKQNSKAIPSLIKLENKAQHLENILFAKSNLMKLYFEENNFENAIDYAKKILSAKNVSNEITADAHYILARCYFEIHDEKNAQNQYQIVLKQSEGERAAEALYFKAYFENKKQLYKQSNQTIQKLAKQYSQYKLFSAKSLILMAQNFQALNDDYQAHFILETITKNFQDYPEILKQATSLLEEVKQKAALNNSSVEVERL